MIVVKRNGSIDLFNAAKIQNAITKADKEAEDSGDLYTLKRSEISVIVTTIEARCNLKSSDKISVEDIQDIVELELMRSGAFDTAKRYIIYRYLHNVARNQYSEFMNAIGDKLGAKNVQNQNANLDEHSFGGRMGEAASLVSKRFALDYCMTPKMKYNHENNRVYIHDLDAFAVGDSNCLSIPFDQLLETGFDTRQTDIRGAGRADTALQLVAVISQLQSLQQFG